MTPWPRVTQVRDAVGLGPQWLLNSECPTPTVLERNIECARQRGQRIHALIEAQCYGYAADTDIINPDDAPWIAAYSKFLGESEFSPRHSEVEVKHDLWQYIGHVDLVGFLNGQRGVVDVKTGMTHGAQVQLGGYFEAWNACRPTEPLVWAACLQLRGDGTYRFREVDLPAATQDWFAALRIYRARPDRELIK